MIVEYVYFYLDFYILLLTKALKRKRIKRILTSIKCFVNINFYPEQ